MSRRLCEMCGTEPVEYTATTCSRKCTDRTIEFWREQARAGYRSIAQRTQPAESARGSEPDDEVFMEQFRCPSCGFLTDTPNHQLGCDAANPPPPPSRPARDGETTA